MAIHVDGDVLLIHECVIKGHHFYKDIWTPRTAEVDLLLVQREPKNEHDR